MPTKDQTPNQEGTLGAGSEAAPSKESQPNHGAASRDREHKGSYGGDGGAPRTSSNDREPINPS